MLDTELQSWTFSVLTFALDLVQSFLTMPSFLHFGGVCYCMLEICNLFFNVTGLIGNRLPKSQKRLSTCIFVLCGYKRVWRLLKLDQMYFAMSGDNEWKVLPLKWCLGVKLTTGRVSMDNIDRICRWAKHTHVAACVSTVQPDWSIHMTA